MENPSLSIGTVHRTKWVMNGHDFHMLNNQRVCVNPHPTIPETMEKNHGV